MEVPGLDLTAFRTWYDAQRPGEIDGELTAELVAGGKSNLTYVVTDGSRDWIVRRPPLGHVQATAHDMGREFTAMSALAGTDVPVPEMYAHCADPDVLGAPFYVMERIDGRAYRRAAELDELGAERTAALAGRLVEVLAALHAVDPEAVGLGEFGRPQGFLDRQVRRWGQQLEGSKTREHPDAEELHRRLTAQVAAVEAGDAGAVGIVHGDYRLDNCLVGSDEQGDDRIHAVVDWEMATLGDTRTDVALMLVYETLGASAGGDLVSDVAKAKGWPGHQQQLAAYAAASGREPGDLAGGMNWHLALAYFKLAVILEGIHYRYLKGQTVGEGFDRIGEGFDLIIAAGLHSLSADQQGN
jgi:aminoglycoside phosphotransferase (APT) family kinase protein